MSPSDNGKVFVGLHRSSANVGEMPPLNGLIILAIIRFTRITAAGVVTELEDSRKG